MEYLRDLFHDSLNEEGVVDVAGYAFYRDTILRELESEGYKMAFDDWFEQRKEDNLSRAEGLLELYDNGSRFKKLQTIYKSGAVIPFVGAGLSMPSGYPSWTAFLYSLLPDTHISQTAFDALISAGEYEDAAQLLYDDMPNGCFLERLENEFGDDKDLLGPVQRLPHMFKSAVVTTNFDSVVKRCYDSVSFSFEEELLGADAIEFPRALGENKRTLVKLHGTASSSRKRILTRSEYDAHYTTDSEIEAVVEAISNRTLLFLGCSLSVDRTIQALTRIVQRKGINNAPRHYAFLKLENEAERLVRRDALSAANIFPIWYTEDHDECIEALLEKLAEDEE